MADNITRYNRPIGITPFSEAMNRLFREAFAWPGSFGGAFGPAGGVGMAGNLYETNDSYILQGPLLSVKVDELEITVRENILTLRGRTAIAVPQGARMIWSGMAGEEFGEQDLLAPLAAQSAVALRLDPALSGQAHVQADPQRLKDDPATREIPVVVVSADATREQEERLLAAGTCAYLIKPLDVRSFLHVVHAALLQTAGRGLT